MQHIVHKERNSLIELYRFIFALIILWYHDFFFTISKSPISGNIVVCFFFIVSGFYLRKTLESFLEKHQDDKQSIITFIKKKLVKMGIPLLICYLFSVADTIISGDFLSGFSHFLWFIHIWIIVETILLIIHKYIKNEKIIYVILVFMIIIGLVFRIIPETNRYSEAFAFIYIPLGYFINLIKIPKLKLSLTAIPILITTFLSIYLLFYESTIILELLEGFILFPLLLILIVSTEFKVIKLFNILGAASLYIYIYQTVTRFLRTIKMENNNLSFLIIMVLSLVTMIAIHSKVMLPNYKLKKVQSINYD